MSEKMELTEREKQILSGNDPDNKVEPVKAEVDQEENPESAVRDDETSGGEAEDKGKDAPVADKDTKDEESEGTEDSWLDEETKALADSYDFSEDELKEFGSKAEFARATRLLDKRLAASLASKEEQEAEDDEDEAKEKANKKTDKKKSKSSDAEDSDDDELNLEDFADYDENTKKVVKVTKKLKDELKSLKEEHRKTKESYTQAEAQRTADAFHDSADALEETIFGRSLDKDGEPLQLTAKQNQARQKLWETVQVIASGIVSVAQKQGKQPKLPDIKVLVKRAEALEFADELKAAELKKSGNKAKQASSARRNPNAVKREVSNKSPSGGGGFKDIAKEISSSPDVVKIWNRMMEEQGKE